MSCPKVLVRGGICNRKSADPNEYADKTLNFDYCSIHIWQAAKVEPVSEVVQAVPVVRQLPRTAAREALNLCKRFYPWRATA